MSWNRIKYFSKHDLAGFHNLEKAEEILVKFDETKDYDINDIIELFQIKQYFDNEVYLSKWSYDQIKEYKSICKKIWSLIAHFWSKISSTNLLELFDKLESCTLQESFWNLTAQLSVYKQISSEAFVFLINNRELDVRAILHHEKIVKFYGPELRNLLLRNIKSAELILSQYVEKHDKETKNLYFPKCLSLKDKEDLISKYLDNNDANLNFVRLVLNIKKQDQLNISDRTRLKAKRLEERLNNEIFNSYSGVSIGVRITFSEDQHEPILKSIEGLVNNYSYSKNYIFKSDDLIYYINHFINLFNYLDKQFCFSMVSKNSEFETIEKVLLISKNEYPIGINFIKKDALTMGQLVLYDSILIQAEKNNIEQLIKYYIVEHINKAFNLKEFRFKLPSSGTSYIEKIRGLLAEFDALLRQYKLFFENGEIDYELLQMSSNTYNFSQIPSFVTKKYCYSISNHFATPNRLLFSDQSHLCYVDPFKNSGYRCLYDLMLSENVLFENYEAYQVQGINYLIDEGYLLVDGNGILGFRDIEKMFIVKQLYINEVLSYWHYSEPCRNIIDEMVNNGILHFENTLFNKLECNYLNYNLNMKEFTNGLDIRNSFMHGTNPESESELKDLYYKLLRIIILSILKIDDDQSLKIKSEYYLNK